MSNVQDAKVCNSFEGETSSANGVQALNAVPQGNYLSLRPSKNDRWFRCEDCPYKSNYKENIKKHRAVHKRDQMFCEICPYKTIHKEALKVHMLRHLPEDKRPYECSYCCKKYTLKINLTRHIFSIHDFTCFLCMFKTSRKTELQAHMLIHKPKRNDMFECADCSKKYETKQGLCHHITMTHQPKGAKKLPFRCSYCQYRCDNRKRLADHELVHKADVDRPLFECAQCSYKSKARNQLCHHIREVHSANPKIYKCPLCTFYTKFRSKMKHHVMKTHRENTFECAECSKKYKSKLQLRSHLRTHVHQKSESRSSKRYRQELEENNHLDKIYQCEHCPMKTKYKYTLDRHTKSHYDTSNNLDKIYQCEHCPFKTNYKYNLDRHTKRHYDTGNRLIYIMSSHDNSEKYIPEVFECAQCPFKSKFKSNVRRHIRDGHTNGTLVFQCLLCPYNTKTKQDFKLHKNTHRWTEYQKERYIMRNTLIDVRLKEVWRGILSSAKSAMDLIPNGHP